MPLHSQSSKSGPFPAGGYWVFGIEPTDPNVELMLTAIRQSERCRKMFNFFQATRLLGAAKGVEHVTRALKLAYYNQNYALEGT